MREHYFKLPEARVEFNFEDEAPSDPSDLDQPGNLLWVVNTQEERWKGLSVTEVKSLIRFLADFVRSREVRNV